MEPNTLALILTGIAVLAIYFLRKPIKRNRSDPAGDRRHLGCLRRHAAVCRSLDLPIMSLNLTRSNASMMRSVKNMCRKTRPREVALENEEQTSSRKRDASNNNYNVRQSKIAIGSGGLIGKGLLKGTQTRYDFVPEQKTDFIFCTIGEGFGFFGSLVFLGIYVVLLMRIVTIAERQRSVFSRCYAYGVASVLFFHITINVCMTIGLAPVIGIPLPFISYGGTSLLTFSIMLFILVRLDADRQMVLR